MSDILEPPAGALATIEKSDLVAVFTTPDGIEAILSRLEKDARARAARLDVSREADRKEMASLARTKIARSKTALLDAGKKLTEDWRRKTDAVRADCKVIETRMDALRDEVRAPLTAWENREKDRVAAHEAALAAIAEAPGYGENETAHALRQRYDALCNYPARDWEEFAQRAHAALTAEILRTEGLLAAAVKREAEAAELVRLRAEEAERQRIAAEEAQREREAQIAAEAAARAKREAEEAAAKREQEARDAAARAEREKQESEAREAQAKRALEEANRRAAADLARMRQEQAEADARREREAEAARIAAAEQAERDRQAAVETERQRAADAKAAADREAARRAADREHRGAFNREILADMVSAMSAVHSGNAAEAEAIGKAIIAAIAKGAVRHVAVNY